MSSFETTTKDQPEPTSPLTTAGNPNTGTAHPAETVHESRVGWVKRKFLTREGWLGDYDYVWLCMPTLPTFRGTTPQRRLPPFYALHADLPLLLAVSCGLQHALAMLAGLITPPIIFASSLNLDASTSSYMISASLIGCGE